MLLPSRRSQQEQEWSRRRQRQFAVLEYLSVNGPSHWSEIYTHLEQFENGAALTHALRYLSWTKSIMIANGTTTITSRGIEQLKREDSQRAAR